MPIVSKEIKVSAEVRIGGRRPLFAIVGPCVIESREHTLRLAAEIKAICSGLGVPLIFKASFDKANRLSLKSFRGPGLEAGLETLAAVKKELGLPVLSDVHETGQVETAAKVLDVIQIPAFLCRQTDLLLAAAGTGKPVNLKKGQFLSPYDMEKAVEKITSRGNENIILTERGTFFGYNNLVFDVRSVPIMKAWGYPVAVDASHLVQKPGGRGAASGGEAEFISVMAKAGVSVGADGLFLEVHENPEQAPSDKYNVLNINKLQGLLAAALRLRAAAAED